MGGCREGHTVIVCVDSSDACASVISHALGFIDGELDRVAVVSAYEYDLNLLHGLSDIELSSGSGNLSSDMSAYVRKACENLVNHCVVAFKSNHVKKVEGFVEYGSPKHVIERMCNDLKPGMLVVGSRGLGKLKKAIIGSVSSYCLYNVPCPVLIVP
eukprot:Nk52_evm12s161 gene=Nk52_evmTU12s161